jgi:hypothetical protein
MWVDKSELKLVVKSVVHWAVLKAVSMDSTMAGLWVPKTEYSRAAPKAVMTVELMDDHSAALKAVQKVDLMAQH